MPRHVFSFPAPVRDSVRHHAQAAVRAVNPNQFRQEPAYCAALAARLQGVAYEGPGGRVEFSATIVSDRGYMGAAEGWSGADMAITAVISDGRLTVRKAILVQAKRGDLVDLPTDEVERLRVQLEKMRGVTRSPKIMDIRLLDGFGDPGFYSGNIYLQGGHPSRYDLADYLVQRVLTTMDGDTRPLFVAGVQDSDLTTLRVLARKA